MMRTMVCVLAMLTSCDNAKKEAPTPTPTPTPTLTTPDATTTPTQTACDALLVFLETGGTWIGAPPDVSCFGENQPGGRDIGWIKATLRTLQSKLGTCTPALEVAAANGVSYQDVITVMDLGMAAGLTNVGLSNPVDLSMRFTARKQPTCDGPLATTPSGLAASTPARMTTAKDDLKSAPLVVITKTEIKLGTETILLVADAMRDSNKNTLPELQRAIPAGSKMVILQADQDTDAKVINRVIKSTKSAGVDNLLFAVNNK